jgi:hypothetical protein
LLAGNLPKPLASRANPNAKPALNDNVTALLGTGPYRGMPLEQCEKVNLTHAALAVAAAVIDRHY